MRKFIAVTIVLLMVAAMLSSVAFAENGKEHKGGLGAGKGQNQSQTATGNDNKGNSNGSDHANGKSNAEGTGIASEVNDDEETGENTGDAQEDADDDDKNGKGEPAGQVKKNNNENKPDEKQQEGPNHGNAYGRVRNEQEVLDDIGLLAGEETAVQLNTLMTAYREAKDAETAKATLTALLDALTLACTTAAENGTGDAAEIQEQLALVTQFREKVMANAGNDNGTFLALMHAYENMFRVTNGLEPVEEPEDGAETDPETVPDAVPGM